MKIPSLENYGWSGYVLFVLLIGHMTIGSILLINLLIAMFSNTFNRLENDIECIWKFQHYSLVCYHFSRPRLPPPFIFFSHLWAILLFFFSSSSSSSPKEKFTLDINEQSTREMEQIEKDIGYQLFIELQVRRRRNICLSLLTSLSLF